MSPSVPSAPASAAASEGRARGWRVVLPVKGTASAKSRLGAVRAAAPALPLALALDALDAVLACPAVDGAWVVSADPVVTAALAARGAVAVRERSPGAGLLAAVADGLAAVARARGDGGTAPAREGGVAVLLADVPCLRPEDLAEALDRVEAALRAGAAQAAVLDAEGTGTVLLAARTADRLTPRFGRGSAAAHRAAGAAVVTASARLRRDVDTPDELHRALALGVGPATRAALAAALRAS